VVSSSSSPNTVSRPNKQQGDQGGEITEIFFSHRPIFAGQHVLLVEGPVHSGVTSEFLMNDLRARGAASVKLVTLLTGSRPPRGFAARLFRVPGGRGGFL